MSAPSPVRRPLSRSRLAPVASGLAALAAALGARDLARRRDPLRGPALPLALAAGWSAVTHATARRPHLTYTRGLRVASHGAVVAPPDGLWCVDVANAGDAAARVVAVCYLGERDGREVRSPEALDLRPLFGSEPVDERDYLLARWLPGLCLAPGESARLMELPLPLARAFDLLGVALDYAGPFGERTRLTVTAHPPHGLPPGEAQGDAPGAG